MFFIQYSIQVKLLYSSKSSYSPKWEQRKCQLSSVHQSQGCWLMSRHQVSGPGSLSVSLLLARNRTDTSKMNEYHLTETFLAVLFKNLSILEKFLWLFWLYFCVCERVRVRARASEWVWKRERVCVCGCECEGQCVWMLLLLCIWWLELYSASVQICWHIRWLQAVRQKKFLMAFKDLSLFVLKALLVIVCTH